MKKTIVTICAVSMTLACSGSTAGTGAGGASAAGGVAGTAGVGGSGAGGSGGGPSGCALTDPGVTGCSLKVLASGVLPPAAFTAALVSGPGLVVTPDGFVGAVREMNVNGDAGHVRLLGLSDCGEPAVRGDVDLAVNKLGCAGGAMSDGIGVAFANAAGLATASLPNCNGEGGGVLLMPFNSRGELHADPSGPRNITFQKFTMVSPTGSVAPGASASDFELVYRIETGPTTANLQRVVMSAPPGVLPVFKSGVVPSVTNPLGADDIPFARVVSSSKVRAFVGMVASKTPSGVVMSVGPNDSDTLQPKGEVTMPAANWAVATAWEDKAAALVPTSSGGTFKVARLSGDNVTTVTTGDVPSASPLKGAAITTLGDNMLVALATNDGITLHRFAGAMSTVPQTPTSTVPLDVDAALLADFDGSHIAIAAGRTRVAILWLNASSVPGGKPLGGWAILQCAPGFGG